MRRRQSPRKDSRRCDQSGKVRFRDHKQAIDALHVIKMRRTWAETCDAPSRRREVRTYLCHRCNGWHLTSHPGTVSAKAA